MYIFFLFHHGSELPASLGWSEFLPANSGILDIHFLKGRRPRGLWVVGRNKIWKSGSRWTRAHWKIDLFIVRKLNWLSQKESPEEIGFLEEAYVFNKGLWRWSLCLVAAFASGAQGLSLGSFEYLFTQTTLFFRLWRFGSPSCVDPCIFHVALLQLARALCSSSFVSPTLSKLTPVLLLWDEGIFCPSLGPQNLLQDGVVANSGPRTDG